MMKQATSILMVWNLWSGCGYLEITTRFLRQSRDVLKPNCFTRKPSLIRKWLYFCCIHCGPLSSSKPQENCGNFILLDLQCSQFLIHCGMNRSVLTFRQSRDLSWLKAYFPEQLPFRTLLSTAMFYLQEVSCGSLYYFWKIMFSFRESTKLQTEDEEKSYHS